MRRLSVPLLAVVALLFAPAVAQAVRVDRIAGDLRSPRHLDFSPWGDLYVAEAGRGGDVYCFVGGEGDACSGPTGAITRISRRGHVDRVVDGLASYANDLNQNRTVADDGDSGIGPHGLVADWTGVYFTSGGPTAPVALDGTPLTRDALAEFDPSADGFGRLMRLSYFGHRVRSVADIYEFEAAENPDGGAIDTNATDVLLDHGKFVISDAGGNSLIRSSHRGLSTLSVFPIRPDVPNELPFGPPFVDMQAVPTAVVEGPDGAYYMSQLTGFPFPIGGANIYRVNPRTGAYKVFKGGFTNIMDLAFDKHGTLYVLEIDSNGVILEPPNGAIHAISRKGKRSVVVPPDGTLTSPGGITVGPRGDLYVTNNARSPDEGEVLRIRR